MDNNDDTDPVKLMRTFLFSTIMAPVSQFQLTVAVYTKQLFLPGRILPTD